METERNYKKLDNLTLIGFLGRGHNAKVYLAQDDSTKKQYALKRLKESSLKNMEAIENEVKVLKSLKHPNIIKISGLKEGTLNKPDGTAKSRVPYSLMELAPNGEILHYLMASGAFPVRVARHYFKSLMYALQFCHEKGVAHRDIKPDNLLLGEKFELKLADFGFSAILKEKSKKGVLYSHLGTDAYMAPEVRSYSGYNGPAVDVFGAGIMLFIMVAGRPPFNKATPDDKYYLPFCSGKHEKFWELHSVKTEDKDIFTEDFMELINGMLAYDPQKRFSGVKVMVHNWVKGKEASPEEVQQEMESRKGKAEKIIENSRQRVVMKPKKEVKPKGKDYRTIGNGSLEEIQEIKEFNRANSHLEINLTKPRVLSKSNVNAK